MKRKKDNEKHSYQKRNTRHLLKRCLALVLAGSVALPLTARGVL